jgi:hypothetical protein
MYDLKRYSFSLQASQSTSLSKLTEQDLSGFRLKYPPAGYNSRKNWRRRKLLLDRQSMVIALDQHRLGPASVAVSQAAGHRGPDGIAQWASKEHPRGWSDRWTDCACLKRVLNSAYISD